MPTSTPRPRTSRPRWRRPDAIKRPPYLSGLRHGGALGRAAVGPEEAGVVSKDGVAVGAGCGWSRRWIQQRDAIDDPPPLPGVPNAAHPVAVAAAAAGLMPPGAGVPIPIPRVTPHRHWVTPACARGR